jgi:hypothetical protein
MLVACRLAGLGTRLMPASGQRRPASAPFQTSRSLTFDDVPARDARLFGDVLFFRPNPPVYARRLRPVLCSARSMENVRCLNFRFSHQYPRKRELGLRSTLNTSRALLRLVRNG